MPDKYNYRLPGVADEFWPITREMGNPGGAENYGWGATLPMNIIRNVIGFREVDNLQEDQFTLTPSFPEKMAIKGKSYGMNNLQFHGMRIDIMYSFLNKKQMEVELICKSKKHKSSRVRS